MSCRIFFDSTAETIVAWRKCRFRFLFFDDRMCRLNPLLRLIFPVPVTRNLFAADRLVLIFGTEYSFTSINLIPRLHFGVSSIAIFRPSRRGSISTLATSWT